MSSKKPKEVIIAGQYTEVYMKYLVERLKRASYALEAMEITASKEDKARLKNVFGGTHYNNVCHEAAAVMGALIEELKKGD